MSSVINNQKRPSGSGSRPSLFVVEALGRNSLIYGILYPLKIIPENGSQSDVSQNNAL